MTTPQPEGTMTETLPFPDGRVLTVVTALASGDRTATLDGALVPPGEIAARVAEWQDDRPPQQPPQDSPPPGADGARQRHLALLRSRAFRGARGRPA